MSEQQGLVQVSARLPREAIDGLDAIVALNKKARPGARFTRSDALREAVLYVLASKAVGA